MRVGHAGVGLDPDSGLVRQGTHLPDDGETRIAGRPVHGGGVEEVIEALLLLEVTGHINDRGRLDDDAQVAAEV